MIKFTKKGDRIIKHKVLFISMTLCLFACAFLFNVNIFADDDPFLGHTFNITSFDDFVALGNTNWTEGDDSVKVLTVSTETYNDVQCTKYTIHENTKIVVQGEMVINSNVIIEGASSDYNKVNFERYYLVSSGGTYYQGSMFNCQPTESITFAIRNASFNGRGKVASKGGIVLLNDGNTYVDTNLFIDNCYFYKNGTGSSGSIVYSSNRNIKNQPLGSVNISNSYFKENSTKAGQIASNYAPLTVTNSTFENNIGTTGAAIYGGGLITIDDCTFKGNEATKTSNDSYGGAIYIKNNKPNDANSITNCTFEDNIAECEGGAIYSVQNFTVSDCTFINNTAGNRGGAIYSVLSGIKANINIEDSTFTGCDSNGGGSMYIGNVSVTDDTHDYDGQVTISNVDIEGKKNSNCLYGQGIEISNFGIVNNSYVGSNTKYILDDVNISNCHSINYGAAIEAESVAQKGILEISNSNIFENKSEYSGGGIYSTMNKLKFDNCNIYGNTAIKGGAIHLLSDCEIINSNIYDNKANCGGAIYIPNGDEQGCRVVLKGTTEIPYNSSGEYVDTLSNRKDNYFNDIYLADSNVYYYLSAPLYYGFDYFDDNPYIVFDNFDFNNMISKSEKLRLSMVLGMPGVKTFESTTDLDLDNIYNLVEISHATSDIDYDEFTYDTFNEDGIYGTKVLSNKYTGNILVPQNYKLSKDTTSGNIKYNLVRDLNLFDTLALKDKIYDGNGKSLEGKDLIIYNEYYEPDLYNNEWLLSFDPTPKAVQDLSNVLDLNELDITYSNNVNPGIATAVIKAKDNSTKYLGQNTLNFNILFDITTDDTFKVYKLDSNIYVYSKGSLLTKDSDYEIVEDNNTTIKIKGLESTYYTGEKVFNVINVRDEIEWTNTDELIINANEKYSLQINDMKNFINYTIEDVRDSYKIKAKLTEGTIPQSKETDVNTLISDLDKLKVLNITSEKYVNDVYTNETTLKNNTEVEIKLSKDNNYDYSDIKVVFIPNSLDTPVSLITPASLNIDGDDIELKFNMPSCGIIVVVANKEEKPQGGNGGGGSSSHKKTKKEETPEVITHNPLLEGDDTRAFKPLIDLTREEFATFISRLEKDYDPDKDYSKYIKNALDYKEGHWSNDVMGYMVSKNYMTLDEENHFMLNSNSYITRGEFAHILVKVKNLKLDIDKFNSLNITLKDIEGMSYEDDVKILVSNGYINGFEDNTFRGEKFLRRCEMCKIICIMEDRLIANPNLITYDMKQNICNKFIDLDINEWYIPYVYELTMEHTLDQHK